MAAADAEKQPLLPSSDHPQDPQEQQQPTIVELRQRIVDAQRDYYAAFNRSPTHRWSLRFAALAVSFWFSLMLLTLIGIGTEVLDDEISDPRVPLDVHIMSKCPDARDCLHDMILPAMVNVSHLVDFRLDYIGKYVLRFISSPVCCGKVQD